MTRRQILAVAGSAPAWLSSSSLTAQTQAKTRMGGAPTAFSLRARGSGGMRAGAVRLPAGSGSEVRHRRALPQHRAGGRADQSAVHRSGGDQEVPGAAGSLRHASHIAIPRLPQDSSGVAAFEAQVRALQGGRRRALPCGAHGTALRGFQHPRTLQGDVRRIKKSVELAEPILRKYRITLGVENHKGYRAAEQAAWLKRVGSEWVGVCLDFGNNMSLCEDPMETLRMLAPLHCLRPHQGYGGAGVRGWLPAIGSCHGRGDPGSEADRPDPPAEGSEHALLPGDDHARSAARSRCSRTSTGRHSTTPTARCRAGTWPRSCRSGPQEPVRRARCRAPPG